MREPAGEQDRAGFEVDDLPPVMSRVRGRRSQSRTSLALVVVAVAALVVGLGWRSGLVPTGDDPLPTGSESPSISESASPTASPSSDASLQPTPSPTPNETASTDPSAIPTSPAIERPTPSDSPSPIASPSLTPAPTVAGPASPRMSCVRHRSVAVKLADGRVLVAGGCVSDNDGKDAAGNWIFGGADVFDPRTGKFASTGKMTTTRDMESTLLLPDGRVLFVGGSSGRGGDPNSTEFYDPATGRFAPGPRTSNPRGTPGLFQLADGRILVVGGDATDPGSTDTAEILDPATGAFTPAGPLAIPGVYGKVSGATLPDGRVFFMASAYSDKYRNGGQIYDPATNTFVRTADPVKPVDGWGQVALLSSGKLLLIGGNTDGPLQSYDPATNKFTRLANMPKPLNVSTATLLAGGKVLVLGSPIAAGQQPWTGWSTSSAGLFDPRPAPRATDSSMFMTSPEAMTGELYDPSTGRWALLGNTAQGRAWYAFNTVALDDGRALIVGGGTNTGEIFDPKTNRFTLLK